MAKLPIEFKTKWVAALRSGEYKQGRSWLYTTLSDGTHEYCCLGVAACVLDIPKQYMDRTTLTGVDHPNVTKDITDALNTTCTEYPREMSFQSMLMGMNDGGKDGFPEIADYIEQNL